MAASTSERGYGRDVSAEHTDAMRGTRPIALETISFTDPRASSWRMPGSPPTVMSVSVRARRLLVRERQISDKSNSR
jgi:hypothetical protein